MGSFPNATSFCERLSSQLVPRNRLCMFARLLILFITIPILELVIFVMLGSKLGFPLTLLIILTTAVIGAYLSKSQGLRALRRYQEAVASGKLPHREILEGLIILVAGVLLMTPGFLTDTIGFLLLVPPLRDIVRQLISASLSRRFSEVGDRMGVPRDPDQSSPMPIITVEAEVVETKANERRPGSPS